MILDNVENSLEDLPNVPSANIHANGFEVSTGRQPSSMDFLDFDLNNPKDLSSLSLKNSKKKALEKVENEVIGCVLEKTAWNRSKTKKISEISYKTLLSKIQEFELTPTSI